jgi:hypothetical protein
MWAIRGSRAGLSVIPAAGKLGFAQIYIMPDSVLLVSFLVATAGYNDHVCDRFWQQATHSLTPSAQQSKAIAKSST